MLQRAASNVSDKPKNIKAKVSVDSAMRRIKPFNDINMYYFTDLRHL